MTVSFWLITAIVLIFCGYLFKRTVSNDAQNDFKLRDIMSNTTVSAPIKKEEEEQEEISSFPGKNLARKSGGFEFKDEKIQHQESVSSMNMANTNSSTTYSTQIHDNNSIRTNSTPSAPHTQEESYYQKDRCMVTDRIDDEPHQTTVHSTLTMTETKTEPITEKEEETNEVSYSKEFSANMRKEYTPTINKLGVFDYIKTFWKGMTFALGVPALIYGLFSFITNAPTMTEKLTYSIWMLLGVILIK